MQPSSSLVIGSSRTPLRIPLGVLTMALVVMTPESFCAQLSGCTLPPAVEFELETLEANEPGALTLLFL